MNDYNRIARVIRYLDEHHAEQPNLATLADYVGLSPSHFHQLFSQWAAITPKDFLQCLTLSHAKELLRKGQSVLETTLTSGLSSPSRLHDLCVNLEAASPGEVKSGGAGWTISVGFADSPFGLCAIAESPRGLCHLSFIDTANDAANDVAHDAAKTLELAQLQKIWHRAQLRRDDFLAAQLAAQIFARPLSSSPPLPLRALVRGTPFQVQVWKALLQIPPNTLVSYRQIAAALGKPTAARAVGSAIGQNQLAYLIPCHRVIRETGVMSNYRWDPIRKRAIIAWEVGQ